MVLCPYVGVIKRVEACGRGRKHLRREKGCPPECCRVPQRGDTPLHLAAHYGSVGVVEQLLAAGADQEAKDEVRG